LALFCITPKDQQDAPNAVRTLHPVWLPIATAAAKNSIKADARSVGWIQLGEPVSARASPDRKSVTVLAAAFFLTPISIVTKGWAIKERLRALARTHSKRLTLNEGESYRSIANVAAPILSSQTGASIALTRETAC
jgi:hypothetical protein